MIICCKKSCNPIKKIIFASDMPRTSRQHSDTGVYHVMLRGIDRCDIFADDQDRGKFLKILRAVSSPVDLDGNPLPPYCHIYAYCLMDNHVHLLIAEGTEDIGNVMKRIGVSYVSYYNKRYERLGPLFHDRFRSEPVGDTGYFITLLRYIHQNPVEAEMVTAPEQYRWSSWHEYTSSPPAQHICTHELPFAALPWQELCEMVLNVSGGHDEPHSKIEQGRMADSEARNSLDQLCGGDSSSLKTMPFGDRKLVIRKAIGIGISMRQLARISTIDYRSIYRIINTKNR